MNKITNVLNRTDAVGLVANVAVSLFVVLVTNGLIFGLGWDTSSPKTAPSLYDPPGWFIGVVWTVLFALMGAARWRILKSGGKNAAFHARLVVGLIVFCLIYPFYTLGLRSILIGLIGNVATAIFAAWIIAQIKTSSRTAAVFVSPVVAWLSFATFLTVRMLQMLS